MPLYRQDRQGEKQANGSIPIYTDWMGGPSLAAILNCPVETKNESGNWEITKCRKAIITNSPDTFFSIPAFIWSGKKRVKGFVTSNENGYVFVQYSDQNGVSK